MPTLSAVITSSSSEQLLALGRIATPLGPRLLMEARWGRHSPHEVDRRPPSTAFFTLYSVFTLGTVHGPGGRCHSLALLAMFPPEEIKLMAEREENPRLSRWDLKSTVLQPSSGAGSEAKAQPPLKKKCLAQNCF